MNEMVLYYDEELSKRVSEYYNDDKDIIPFPEEEIRTLGIIQELNDYARDHDVPFKVISTSKDFDTIQDPGKCKYFITTKDRCFNPDYKTNFDDIGTEIYKDLYQKEFEINNLNRNSEELYKTQNPFEYLAAVTNALENEKELSLVYEANDKNVSPMAEKMTGRLYYCSYIDGEEHFVQKVHAVTDDYIQCTLNKLREEAEENKNQTKSRI